MLGANRAARARAHAPRAHAIGRARAASAARGAGAPRATAGEQPHLQCKARAARAARAALRAHGRSRGARGRGARALRATGAADAARDDGVRSGASGRAAAALGAERARRRAPPRAACAPRAPLRAAGRRAALRAAAAAAVAVGRRGAGRAARAAAQPRAHLAQHHCRRVRAHRQRAVQDPAGRPRHPPSLRRRHFRAHVLAGDDWYHLLRRVLRASWHPVFDVRRGRVHHDSELCHPHLDCVFRAPSAPSGLRTGAALRFCRCLLVFTHCAHVHHHLSAGVLHPDPQPRPLAADHSELATEEHWRTCPNHLGPAASGKLRSYFHHHSAGERSAHAHRHCRQYLF
ncbi:mannose-p-dolichol utilization defect 1 [Gracilaria domingensis]|nr:mannose-p-dolichol utilization defect 1 [Gracilaria domingensis]